ncbi:MAG: LPXTG cell wall anchor domain-containing protein [Candidatus Microsaccharimonas sp.]
MTRSGVALTVGIIILTGLIIGGLFIVKGQGEQARRDEAVKIAEKNLEDRSNEEVALNEGEEENSNESTTSGDNGEATEVPQTGTSNNSESTESGVTAEELPQTGTGDTLAVVGAGALTFAGVAYIRSRKVAGEL